MKVSYCIDRKHIILAAVMFLAAVFICIWSGAPLWYIPVFEIFFLAVSWLDISFPVLERLHKGGAQIVSFAVGILILISGPWFSVWCMQWTILEDELFAKTGKTAFRMNVLCVLILYVAVMALFARVKYTFIISHLLVVLVGFADYFVYEFRENEISIGDMDTIGTGLSVAKNYRFQLHVHGALVLLLTILAITLVCKIRFVWPWSRKTNIIIRMLIRCAAVAAVLWLIPYTWGQIKGRVTQTWEKKGTYRNGFIVNFILGIRDSKVSMPAGYSPDIIEELEKQYKETETVSEESTSTDAEDALQETRPTIITIMDESFADFRLIGDLQTNEEVMPFIDSLTENTTRGYAMTSVYGAKTPNSEWEYLTGHSMAFMPGGSVVYQQFMTDTPTSMVSELKNLGYTAIAMHPYYSTGWRRSTVYPKLGFDEMSFLDTGGFDETNVLRDYVTDQELFDRIIERYEQKTPDEPLFFMGITMQNHGGYKEAFENFTPDIYQIGGEYFFDASTYLSLVHRTDMAVENLISYFSSVDEPVEIIFFGDHYPSLQASFVRSLNGKGTGGLTLRELESLFSVPFFIWTNYDSEEEKISLTSLNYLSTLALEKAGIDLSPYHSFLSDLRKVIPAMNIRGYYSLSEHKFLHIADAAGEEKTWLQKYRYLQYNEMFDKENHSSVFFPYITEQKAGEAGS